MNRLLLFVLSVLAAGADNLTTWYALENWSAAYEANPLAAWGMNILGTAPFLWIEGTLSILLVAWILWWPAEDQSLLSLLSRSGPWIVILMVLLQSAAAANNLWVIRTLAAWPS